MTYLENSFIVSLLVRFWNFICGKFSDSILGSLVRGLIDAFRSGTIWRFLTHDGPASTAWRTSRTCAALQWCLDLPVRFCAWLGKHAPDSLFSRLCAALTAPALGLMLLLLLIIPQSRWNNLYSLLMVCGILLLYLASSLGGIKKRLDLGSTGAWPVFLFLIVALSWLWSDSRALGTRFLFFAVTCAILVLLIVSAADSEKKLIWIIRIGTVGLAVCCLYALYQRFVGVEADEVLTDLSLNANMPGRVYSFFENPNSYANILVFFAPLMLCMALYSKRTLERLAYLAVFLLCGLALLMTYSRGGWLSLAFAIFVMMLFLCPRWVPLVALVCIAAIPFLPDNILHRLLTIFNFSDSSTYTRGYIYSAMLKIIGRHPLFGVGIGADSLRYSIKCAEVYKAEALFIHGHNIYLQIWAESGIFALIAFLGSMFGTMRGGRRALKSASPSGPIRGIIVGCISGLSGALLFGITDYAWSYPRVMILFWFLFSLLLAGIRTINKEAGKNV